LPRNFTLKTLGPSYTCGLQRLLDQLNIWAVVREEPHKLLVSC
jgi:hypothetical protein